MSNELQKPSKRRDPTMLDVLLSVPDTAASALRGGVKNFLGAPGDIWNLYVAATGALPPTAKTRAVQAIGPTKYDSKFFGDVLPEATPISSYQPTIPRRETQSVVEDLLGPFMLGPANAAQKAAGRAVTKAGEPFVPALQRVQNSLSAAYSAPGLPMITWHGSPHRFDRFDSRKIGTGEGAQAYGHGLYLAESPEVAQQYAKTNPAVFSADGKSFFRIIGKPKHEPQVYKVDLPDEMVARMLDWDKPLSQQSPEVMAALQNSGVLESAIKQGGFYPQDVTSGLMEGRHIFPAKRSPKGPEEALRAAGIPGIRYLDEGSRNTALLPHFDVVRKSDGATVMQVIEGGEKRPDIAKLTASGEFELRGPVDKRTRNFVVFPGEENALRILERNGMTLADMAGQSGKIDSRLLAALGLGSAAAVAGNSLLNSGKKKMEDAKKARQQAIDKAEEK